MSDAQTSRAGTTFGPYRLKRLLGRGGMGEVYEAEHTVKEWTVAVKLMSDQFSSDPVFRERMKREARIAGRLQEPHVVPIHDYGEIDGKMFLEMRLVEGVDLDNMLKRFGPLTPPRAVAIISQVASALDAAHASGVMHRDVKPPNVLVTREDFAYLVDFGIASATTDEKLTQLGTAVGTWKYMAPERFSDGEVTYRADIYALACVLHECLTGAPPYKADSAGALVTAHLMDPIPQASAQRSGIPKSLDAVIARGMAKKPGDRYASAGDLALAAHQALSDPDQDHADSILRRSQEATLPAPSETTLPPTLTATAIAPPAPPMPYPNPAGPGPITPLPAQTGPPSWAPSSGPIPGPHYYQGNSGTQGNWGGQPPSGPPPQQFTGPPPWNQPPPRKRNPWPIVAGAAALVVVIILAAVGISLAVSGGDKHNAESASTTTTTTSVANTTKPSSTSRPSNGLQNKLLGMLPGGYPDGTCKPTTPKPDSIWANALAMVDCGPNTNDGGPSNAVYGLFANPDALKKAFDDDIADVQLANCPGGGQSPDSWHYDQNPTVTAGTIACATYKNHPNVIWSNQSKLLLNDVFGDPPAMDDLHTWWAKYG
ncbi:MAG: serine/threonine-protein kinase [Mycobacterium sp.]